MVDTIISMDFIIILVILGLGIIFSGIPVIIFSKRMYGFVKYSEMWKPWKYLFLCWIFTIVGGIAGIISFILHIPNANNVVYLSDIIFLLGPIGGLIFVGTIFLLYGLKQFYQSAKQFEEKRSVEKGDT
ncbi:MAG: hypothetical protein ACTSRG_10250 [Candidatus Helarchaeota archaeon]